VAEGLATLAREVAKDRPGAGVLITVDEIQAASKPDLALLAAALQGLNAEHAEAAVMFAASGLPNTFQAFQEAGVTHADRLFRFREIPLLLDPEDARLAVVDPALKRRVAWEPEAADEIVRVSVGYPAHLQVFADAVWLAAEGPDRITINDARRGVAVATQTLERESLGPRFDAISPREREFLVGVALHGGRVGTARLAATLNRPQKSLSDLRDRLITQGDVYVPQRGELALTVPVFGPYVLDNYEQARELGTNELLPLDEMRRNAAP
jgi:hypothetical protein